MATSLFIFSSSHRENHTSLQGTTVAERGKEKLLSSPLRSSPPQLVRTIFWSPATSVSLRVYFLTRSMTALNDDLYSPPQNAVFTQI